MNLIGFSLTVNGEPASLMTRQENQELTRAAITRTGIPSLDTPQTELAVKNLAEAGDIAEGRSAHRALVTAYRDSDPDAADNYLTPAPRTLTAEALLLIRLERNYVMFARVPDTGTRFRLAWEAHLPHFSDNLTAHGRVEDANSFIRRFSEAALFQWPHLEISFNDVAGGRSAHIEVVLPDGVSPVEATSTIGANRIPRPRPVFIEWGRVTPRGGEAPTARVGDLAGGRLHFASTSDAVVPPGGSLSLPVRPTRGGWLAACFLLTLLALVTSVGAMFALMPEWASIGFLSDLVEKSRRVDPPQADYANSIIAALVSVGSLTAARRDTHELVNRVQRHYRSALVLMSMVLLGSAIVAPTLQPDVGALLWLASAVLAAVFAGAQSVGFLTRRLFVSGTVQWLLVGVLFSVVGVRWAATRWPDTSLSRLLGLLAAVVLVVLARLVVGVWLTRQLKRRGLNGGR